MVHRLLAVAIGALDSYPDLLNKNKTQVRFPNLRYTPLLKIYRPRYEDVQLSVAKADDLLRSTTTSAQRTNELLDKNEESYRY